MYILSLHLGHNATVSLYNKDKFLEVVSQEKFDNIKNSAAFPSDAITYILQKYRLKPSDIDYIVNASNVVFPNQMYDYLQTQKQTRESRLKKIYYFLRYRFSRFLYLIGLTAIGLISFPNWANTNSNKN